MRLMFFTALVVGGATLLGAAIGFLFRKIPGKLMEGILAASAGIMLAAAVLGLILPSLEYGGWFPPGVTVVGIFVGAVTIRQMGTLIPRLQNRLGLDGSLTLERSRAILFVAAILIHKLPEGIAAGVGFGTDTPKEALLIAGGIALQNIPEGMVVVAPMLSVGLSSRKILVCSILTALVEIAGTVLGYFGVTLATAVLPFALAFAGGTMLYVILEEMLPSQGDSRYTFAVLAGFSGMLVCDGLLGG